MTASQTLFCAVIITRRSSRRFSLEIPEFYKPGVKKCKSIFSMLMSLLILYFSEHYAIRWITPEGELDLCGHGTLAASYVIFNYLTPTLQQIKFIAKDKQVLHAIHSANSVTLSFPVKPAVRAKIPPEVTQSIGLIPKEFHHFHHERCLIILENEQQVKNLQPNMQLLKSLPFNGYTFTAPGEQADLVSRTFYPHKTIPEDAVTGASHCLLAPYWAERLGKTMLTAHQISQRGGFLQCELTKDRVFLTSTAVLYSQGTIKI